MMWCQMRTYRGDAIRLGAQNGDRCRFRRALLCRWSPWMIVMNDPGRDRELPPRDCTLPKGQNKDTSNWTVITQIEPVFINAYVLVTHCNDFRN